MKIPEFRNICLLIACLWLAGCAVLLAASLMTDTFTPGLWAQLYFLAVVVLSPVALLAFGWDKWKAGHEKSRIPEKTLHFLALLGGWPGAVIGQRWFRHKTVKPVFRAILISIVLLHIGIAITATVRAFRGE